MVAGPTYELDVSVLDWRGVVWLQVERGQG